MAERRMFSKQIIDSDAFLDMGLSTQALYFHLSMRADDEGFIDNPKKVMRMIGAQQNELELLLAKRYLLGFESGVVVIKHWKIHNYIQKDRFKETLYKEEKQLLTEKENKIYTNRLDTDCVQVGDAGKVRLELGKSKSSIEGEVIKPKRTSRFTPPLLDEVKAYCLERKNSVDAKKFHDYYTASDWHRADGKKVKNWKQSIVSWEGRDYGGKKGVDQYNMNTGNHIEGF